MRNCFVYFVLFSIVLLSCDNNKSCENLQKIKEGMNVAQVIKTMGGYPDSILLNYLGSDQFSYMYKAPYGASENVYINFTLVDSIVFSAHGCQ